MSTMLFFESVPDRFVDGVASGWRFDERTGEVPIIISKDYLALYNFGFAGSAGLPQMSENILSGIPLRLTLTSDDGRRMRDFRGRVVGLSDRLNTILVPESFMEWSNRELGSGESHGPSRLIVDVSSLDFSETTDYLSPAPQAEPQAAGLGSGLVPPSPAPQAEPQAPLGAAVSSFAQR